MFGDDDMEDNPFMDDGLFDDEGLLEDFDEEDGKTTLHTYDNSTYLLPYGSEICPLYRS